MPVKIKRYFAYEGVYISLDAAGVIYERLMENNPPGDSTGLRLELGYLWSRAIPVVVEEEEEQRLYNIFLENFDFCSYFEKGVPWEKVRSECFKDPAEYMTMVGNEHNLGVERIMICERKKKRNRRKGQKF